MYTFTDDTDNRNDTAGPALEICYGFSHVERNFKKNALCPLGDSRVTDIMKSL